MKLLEKDLIWHEDGNTRETNFLNFYLYNRFPRVVTAWICHDPRMEEYTLWGVTNHRPIRDDLYGETQEEHKPFANIEPLLEALERHGFMAIEACMDDFDAYLGDYIHSSDGREKCGQLGASDEWLKAQDDWRDSVLQG